ncbi:hypothetical protein KKC97_08385, partial [bacterium]|nr:hypothetical protein [bacterium]
MSIRNAADLLLGILECEKESLSRQNIKHPPTIGSMYEGLTKDLLQRIVPETLGLTVSSGFIRDKSGNRSRQLDCVIAVGEGEQVPYTDQHDFEFEKVICVVEVKKHLRSKELADSFTNLHSVYEQFEPRKTKVNLVRDAFRGICKKPFPEHEDVEKLPFHEEMIYHALMIDMINPVRIALGYDGFSSEYAFREAFYRFLEKNKGNQGFGPTSMPELIISGKYSLVKLNGMPIALELEDDYWHLYGSSCENPLNFLLEFIFT